MLRTRILLPATCMLGLTACAALAPFIPAAISFASDLLGISETNWGEPLSKELEQVLVAYFEEAPNQAAASSGVGSASGPPATPLEVDLTLLKEEDLGGRILRTSIPNGGVLYDGKGPDRDGVGDKFRLVFRVNQESWVYILNVDATAYPAPLFPNPSFSLSGNPVPPGVDHMVPTGEPWGLDGYRGTEHFFVLVSRVPRPELDAQFAEWRTRPKRPANAQVETSPEIVRSGASGTRGIEGGTVAAPGQPAAGAATVDFTRLMARDGENSVAETRWFEHR